MGTGIGSKAGECSTDNGQQLQAAIQHRAEEIYQNSGKMAGRDQENWLQAEAEILQQQAQQERGRPAVVLRINGKQYIGEYSAEPDNDYSPGEFAKGDPVEVRFEGEKIFLKRRNGKELETRIADANGS
jgi:Protein of unknown function (DUF2934)